MDCNLLLMTRGDFPVPECNLIIHQPSIKEIGLIGETDFFVGIQTLCIKKTMLQQDESLLSNTNNFQIFMAIMNAPEAVDKKYAVEQVLTLVLPQHQAKFTPQSLLLIGKENAINLIDENNFEPLQEALRTVFCLNAVTNDQTIFDPANKEAQRIAEKIMRGRAKIAAEKGLTKGSVLGQYLSILSIGLHISFSELMNYTLYQIYDALERFNLYVAWDIDKDTRLAGGKPDRQPENWMKNIH